MVSAKPLVNTWKSGVNATGLLTQSTGLLTKGIGLLNPVTGVTVAIGLWDDVERSCSRRNKNILDTKIIREFVG